MEINENMHQYPIRPKNSGDQLLDGVKKMSINDVTVVIPVFCPQTDVMNNMRFIINKFLDLNLKVVVVEQTADQYSYLFKFIESIMIARGLTSKTLSFGLYVSQENVIQKEKLIESALKNNVKTSHVWINDPNFLLDYERVIQQIHELVNCKIIVPYSKVNTLSSKDTASIISGKEVRLKSKKRLKSDHYYSIIINKKTIIDILIDAESKNEPLDSIINKLSSKKMITRLEETGIHLYSGPIIELVPKMTFTKTDFEKDMAIIVCHFNWCKYINPTRNLNRFLRQMEIEDAPVYGIELSLNDKFETKNRKNWINIKVDTKNVCFQKEACINLVEKSIPKNYKKIAWIDPDLHFTNKNWYRETSEKLNTHKLVQMYSDGYGTDRYGRISRRHPSIMAMYGKVPMDYWFKHPGHPGGAWAAQREFWDNGGLYPYCIMGGGDTVFVYTIFDYTFANDVYSLLGICGDNIFAPYAEWKDRIKKYVKPEDITYVNNSFIHEWHGDSVNRNYNLRHNIAKTIDMTKNVRLNETGIIELYDIKKKSIYDGIYGYFKGRDEDGLMGDMEAYINFKNELNEKNA